MLRALILSLSLSLLAGCGEEPTPEAADPLALGMEVPDYSPTGGPGSPCRTDADCQNEALTCDLSLPQVGGVGICTDDCVDMPGDEAAEQDACGGETGTCLGWEDGGDGLCTLACDVDARPGEEGACALNQVCTTHALWREPDTAGCLPFCQDDSACGPYQSCDVRSGICVALGTGERPDLLPDGSACSVRAVDADGRSEECRGACLNTGSGGICGSFIDRARTEDCPDDPERISPRGFPEDNMAICAFAVCNLDDECSEGTTCTTCSFGGRCCMP